MNYNNELYRLIENYDAALVKAIEAGEHGDLTKRHYWLTKACVRIDDIRRILDLLIVAPELAKQVDDKVRKVAESIAVTIE